MTDFRVIQERVRSVKAERRRQERARLKERFLLGEVSPTHGKVSTYIAYGCRCDECTEANRDYYKACSDLRAIKRLLGADIPHGKYTTYRNYGCRCAPCTEAQRKKLAESRKLHAAG